MNEKIEQTSMSIILYAGDARLCCKKALDALAVMDIEEAKKEMAEAQKKITEAHKVQTDAIQKEASGEKTEYSLLFAHAQDTLMTIYSEINIAKQLIKIFTNLDKRVSLLEKDRRK